MKTTIVCVMRMIRVTYMLAGGGGEKEIACWEGCVRGREMVERSLILVYISVFLFLGLFVDVVVWPDDSHYSLQRDDWMLGKNLIFLSREGKGVSAPRLQVPCDEIMPHAITRYVTGPRTGMHSF